MAVITITTAASGATGVRPCLSSAGRVYWVGRDTNALRVYKAPSDPFSAGWTEQDTANRPVDTANAPRPWVYQVGDTLHIVSQAAVTGDVKYHTFVMSSDTWGITNESVTTVPGSDVQSGQPSVHVRSDGDVICLYPGATEIVHSVVYDRVSYARRESGTWTADIALDGAGADHWHAGSAVPGSSDRTHFFFVNNDVNDIYQRTLTSANSLQTLGSAFDTTAHSDAYVYPGGISYDDGGTQRVRGLYIDNGAVLARAELDSSDTPTATGNPITTQFVLQGLHAVADVAVDGTNVYSIYGEAGTGNIFYDLNDGTDVELDISTENGARCACNIYTRGTDVVLGVVFSSGTGADDPFYTELFIRSTATTALQDIIGLGVVPFPR